ncbi:hypothetical protein RJ640_022425, partial [Escallonia rubra]
MGPACEDTRHQTPSTRPHFGPTTPPHQSPSPSSHAVPSCQDHKRASQGTTGHTSRISHLNVLPQFLVLVGLQIRLIHLEKWRADLDRHLSSLLRSADVLHLVKFDSDLVLSNDESTSDLADRVSLKVRELDLAQSRVSHTLIRIDAIVERTACIDGVKKDFESAATFVQTFLQIDSKYKDFASDQREQLLASKKQLESIVRKRLSAAVDQRDHATILRFVRLYPPLGLEEEGLQAYVGYLKKVVSMRLRLEFDQLVELMEQSYSSSSVGNQGQ